MMSVLTCIFLHLSGKNLDLYQVLAPNAFSYKEEFIPVIRKTVQSKTHEVSNRCNPPSSHYSIDHHIRRIVP